MKINTNPKKIKEVLERGVEEILPSKEDLTRLMKKKKIRLYLGVDPTASKLHLGHTVGLKKLQQFADLGHEAILVIGTGTVLAGDPSLRESIRPQISEEEIKKNIGTWKKQAGKVLDFSKVKIKYNGDWLRKLNLKDIINLASHISAVKLFQREMFQRRIKKGNTVRAHEILYPLLQGYDSVFMDVDLEIGGTDQVFNMLIGRELKQKMLRKEKFVLTFPMVLGTDGQQMSKTSGNCVWLLDSSNQMFGKIMSIHDSLIKKYLELITNLTKKEINGILEKKPHIAKAMLAKEIVKLYHGEKAAILAEKEFNQVFREKRLPSKIPVFKTTKKVLPILDLLFAAKLVSSRGQGKRLIFQKGVKIDKKTKTDWHEIVKIKDGMSLQVGKRKFVKIKR